MKVNYISSGPDAVYNDTKSIVSWCSGGRTPINCSPTITGVILEWRKSWSCDQTPNKKRKQLKLLIFASQLHVKSLYLGYVMQKVLPMSFRVFSSLSSSCSRRRRRPSFPDGIRTKRKCKKKGKSDLKRNMSSAESTQTTLISDTDKRKREEEFGQTQRDDQNSWSTNKYKMEYNVGNSAWLVDAPADWSSGQINR